jgi:hypothetical protein
VLELYPNFDHKPALMRAYKAADVSGDGWVQRREFHLLLKYLIYFNERWERFEELDIDDDRRVSQTEFRRVRRTAPDELPHVTPHALRNCAYAQGCNLVGLAVSPADIDRAFDAMGGQGGEFVLFEQFCSWCGLHLVCSMWGAD